MINLVRLLPALLVSSAALCGEIKDPPVPEILDLRAQAAVRDAWLGRRLETVVPMLMRREGVDMWILVAREYNEDPVVETMLPATWLKARRRTVIVFHDPGNGRDIEKLSISRYAPGPWFEPAWIPEEHGDQWQRIAEIVTERDPSRIAVNRSRTFPLADGLTATEDEALRDAIDKKYARRLVAGENLALGWLETRIAEEMEVYPSIVRMAHAIIAEGLSEQVIVPGVTTTTDVSWWYRERIRSLGLDTWFHPGVSLERAGEDEQTMASQFAGEKPSPVIRAGDLLHVDFGITYLGLNTDTQHHAYVLKPGETDAPEGLRAGMAANNRLQDILIGNFRTGITGNELVAVSRKEAIAAGIDPTIYSHALGFHGHGAGPWIGMWDDQFTQIPKGEYPVQPNTAWSIELSINAAVPEWGDKMVRFKSEEDAYFDGESVRWLDGRQEELHLIPRQ